MAADIHHRTLAANGIDIHVAEAGSGPLVLLCHGWPELWYSWRHQLVALAEAGFHAAAPDMRGFGGTSAPDDSTAYTVLHTVGDVVALVAELGHRQALIVGHDWGAPVAWHAAMMRPDIFPAVVGMSVPHRRRGPRPPLETLRRNAKADYYYFYFADPTAEEEFSRDPRFTLARIMYVGAGETPREHRMSLYVDRRQGFLGASREAVPPMPWLSDADLDVFSAAYASSGFR
jgi:pimeloyl-ACP methyl ester carboxylesterase